MHRRIDFNTATSTEELFNMAAFIARKLLFGHEVDELVINPSKYNAADVLTSSRLEEGVLIKTIKRDSIGGFIDIITGQHFKPILKDIANTGSSLIFENAPNADRILGVKSLEEASRVIDEKIVPRLGFHEESQQAIKAYSPNHPTESYMRALRHCGIRRISI